MPAPAMLVVFGGLPATGKTTLARALAQELRATYLRIDAIEQALRSSGALADDVGPAGYMAAYALAEVNLRLGQTVVADAVNPLTVIRNAWRATAVRANAPIVEIEILCSDAIEHRRRSETRTSDIPGLVLPTWAEIVARAYEPWEKPHLVLDTASYLPETALVKIRTWMSAA